MQVICLIFFILFPPKNLDLTMECTNSASKIKIDGNNIILM